ncbi:hypothetical protein EYZ11_010725 [Aspergillus tanneri]|uniref:Uncharacterized protein n=1 Tax=Aspergillus tanneri TaxID=1220188 RepID=A0A4S3J4L1_9EURO|nr:hypothetical protein EYZ11_010725 [Aspergillus tanneri]
MAWLMGRSDNVIPILGMRYIKYLNENIGALRGDRYPDGVPKNFAHGDKAELRSRAVVDV